MGKILGLLLLVCLTGCVVPQAPTPSGRPEVTINGRSNDVVKAAVVNYFANAGFQLVRSDQFAFCFEKPGGALSNFLLSTTFDPYVYYRLDVNVIDLGNLSQRIVASPSLIQNRGSGYQRTLPSMGDTIDTTQRHLNNIAMPFEFEDRMKTNHP